MVVVMLTASGEDADIAAAYRLGANAFLVKLSEANKLEDMVKAIRDFWLTHNTLPQESYKERTTHSLTTGPHANHLAGINGRRREEWSQDVEASL
jgi:DNA-binding NarL/FixJ family response regulator